MNAFRRRLFGGDGHKYTLLGSETATSKLDEQLWRRKHSVLLITLVALAGLSIVVISRYLSNALAKYWDRADNIYSSYGLPSSYGDGKPCDTVSHGFQCNTEISHFWGTCLS